MSLPEPIQDLTHGLALLNVKALLLAQLTQSHAPAALIRSVLRPFPGWIAETRAYLETTGLATVPASAVLELEQGLRSLDDLAPALLEKLDAGEPGESLFAVAEAMRQTTVQMWEERTRGEEPTVRLWYEQPREEQAA